MAFRECRFHPLHSWKEPDKEDDEDGDEDDNVDDDDAGADDNVDDEDDDVDSDPGGGGSRSSLFSCWQRC